MGEPTLTFLGAAGTVTGSKFLLEVPEGSTVRRVLVDAGLFQGIRELRRRNWEPFPVAPALLDAVLLTHAHLDHCGFLPVLARDGFTGPVYASQGTAELAALVLRDSAKLQEEDAAYAASKGFSKHAPPKPLYDTSDVERMLAQFAPVPFDTGVDVASQVRATWRPAGHILGSSTVQVVTHGRRVLFSGDLGRPSHPLLKPPEPPPASDVVVVESTYGNRGHEEHGEQLLADAVRRTVRRGGVVLIPAFAVDRTEVVLMALRRLMSSGEIPSLPVFVDSPMALAGLEIYQHALDRHSPELRDDLGDLTTVFDPGDLRRARTAQESMELNAPGRPCIVVSASGMATGGRVVHHLKHLLPDHRNTVLLVGYQAVGTRGRDLVEGAKQLKMHGRYVPVHAEVVAVPGFSVHADADELVGWLGRIPDAPDVVYVVHGEPDAAAALSLRIHNELGWLAVTPRDGELVRLT
ncbi:MAG: MBL fold metallo-hydrolase [Actinomycetes bacterium]